MDVSTVVFHAHDSFNQWTSAQNKNFNSSMAWLKPGDRGEHCDKLTLQTIKVNVDVALFDNAGRFSFGCAARNHDGVLLEGINSCKLGRYNRQ